MAKQSLTPRIVVGQARPKVSPWTIALSLLTAILVSALLTWFFVGADLQGRVTAQKLQIETAKANRQIEHLNQQLAVRERGSQALEQANAQLREEWVRLEQEIAGLRADVAFYQRLLDTGGTLTGLAVHELRLQATPAANVYRFELTLSQNLKKAKVVEGIVGVRVEGLQANHPLVLDDEALGLLNAPDLLHFEFKYFQQIDGTLVLPSGFTPQRVTVMLEPSARGASVAARSFEWTDIAPSTPQLAPT